MKNKTKVFELIDELVKLGSLDDRITLYRDLINGPNKLLHIPVDDDDRVVILVMKKKKSK